MRAIDTNVLVRIFERDDANATASAEAILGDEEIFVSTIVLCELAWVLGRVYRRPRSLVIDVFRRLMDADRLQMDREAVNAGLALMEAGGDFSDAVVLHEAQRAQCRDLATFDRKFARLRAPDVVLIS